jgi:hypothetical protein
MAVDWKGVEHFAEEHWPYLIVGFVAMVGLFYTLSGSSAAAATTAPATAPAASSSGVDPTTAYVAGLQASTAQSQIQAGVTTAEDANTVTNNANILSYLGTTQGQQVQLDIAQVAGGVQTQIAAYQAATDINQTNASAASAAYIASVQAQADVANVAAQAAAGQNIQALSSLTSGFAAYSGAIAQESAADATAAAGVVGSNDQTAARTLQATFQGAAELAGAISSFGLTSALGAGSTSGYQLLPQGSSFTNLSSPVLAGANQPFNT